MTAQIGILNSEVAVLASDSASTVTSGSTVKIFTTSKIFKIADYLPVAIMVNGTATFGSVLWSRVVDLYRKYFDGKEKHTLKDYFDDFINFIETDGRLTDYAKNLDFLDRWMKINLSFLESMYNRSDKPDKAFNSWIRRETDALEQRATFVLEADKLGIVEKSIRAYLFNICSLNYTHEPNLIIRHIDMLSQYLSLKFIKDADGNLSSEVIIAGFGFSDTYPSLASISVEGFFENKIRKNKSDVYLVGEQIVDDDHRYARILPFAQSDGARLFLDGVSPDIDNFYLNKISKDKISLISFLGNHKLFNEIDKEKRLKVLSDLDMFSNRQDAEFEKEIRNFSFDSHISPIMRSVAAMGPEDICELARTLVNLTSLQRRYSINQKESVGGSTTVALLTKEYGFRFVDEAK